MSIYVYFISLHDKWAKSPEPNQKNGTRVLEFTLSLVGTKLQKAAEKISRQSVHSV